MFLALLLCSQLSIGVAPFTPTDQPSGPPIDLERFDRAVAIERLPLGELTPDMPVAYVALRETFGPGTPYYELGSSGTRCRDARDRRACEAAEEAALPQRGFQYGCRPLACFKYLVYTRGDEVGVITNAAEMRAFLGTIDNRTEAQLLTAAHEYHWSDTDLTRGAIRDGDALFDLVVTRMTRDCDPVETTGYLIRVWRSGQVDLLESWLAERQDGICI